MFPQQSKSGVPKRHAVFDGGDCSLLCASGSIYADDGKWWHLKVLYRNDRGSIVGGRHGPHRLNFASVLIPLVGAVRLLHITHFLPPCIPRPRLLLPDHRLIPSHRLLILTHHLLSDSL